MKATAKYITVRLHKVKNARKIETWKRNGYTFNDEALNDYVIFWRINPRWLKITKK